MGDRVAGAAALAGPPPMPWLPDRPQGRPVDPTLGGPLLVGPPTGGGGGFGTPEAPGAVVVASDRLLAHADRLTRVADELAGDAAALATLPRIPADVLAALPSGAGGVGVTATAIAVRSAAETAAGMRDGLRLAIARYTEVEAAQRARMIELGERLGAALGPVLMAATVLGLPAVLLGGATGALNAGQLGVVRDWLLANPALITNPAFVEAVRATTMGIDDAVSTGNGMPPDLMERLAATHGFEGVEVGAALLIGSAGLAGLFRETPVDVRRSAAMPLERGPLGAAERLARVPENDQLRIERYEAPGMPPRYIVYVGPTETFSPRAVAEPWDLTSNVAGVAGLSPGSERAAVAAMRDVGISARDEVQFVGFSQGGLIATRLAASGEWNAVGLETYGAPAGGIELPSGLAGMAVRNTDDFIPALGGPQRDHHLLQVERRAFAPGSPIPDELPAPAHQRSAYVATAAAIDRAQSAAVRDQIVAMDAFARDYTDREGARATVFTYRGERVPVSAGGTIR